MRRNLTRFMASAFTALSLSLFSVAGITMSGVAHAEDETNYGLFRCGTPIISGGFFYGCTGSCIVGTCTYTWGDTYCWCK